MYFRFINVALCIRDFHHHWLGSTDLCLWPHVSESTKIKTQTVTAVVHIDPPYHYHSHHHSHYHHHYHYLIKENKIKYNIIQYNTIYYVYIIIWSHLQTVTSTLKVSSTTHRSTLAKPFPDLLNVSLVQQPCWISGIQWLRQGIDDSRETEGGPNRTVSRKVCISQVGRFGGFKKPFHKLKEGTELGANILDITRTLQRKLLSLSLSSCGQVKYSINSWHLDVEISLVGLADYCSL